MTDHTVLTVRDLQFRYPGAAAPALHRITFDLAAGEVLGVLGPNGSGKSTLLASLLDVRRGERQGTIRFFPREDGDHRRRIGYLSQEPGVYRALTVRENLVHAARLVLPRREVRSAVSRTVAEFQLGEVVDRPVRELSGGWRQRCHLAASFVHDPPVRLLDEPTTALDFETRQRLVQLVKEWAGRGVACVITSHYPEDLEQMCTRLIVIRQGRSIRSAPLADLLAHLRPQLVLHLERADGAQKVGVPLPTRLGDLAGALAAMSGQHGADSPVAEVRVTSARLRDLLEEDPELAGIVVDE